MNNIIECLTDAVKIELGIKVSNITHDEETIKSVFMYAEKNQIMDIVGRGILDLHCAGIVSGQITKCIIQEIILSMRQEQAFLTLVKAFEKEKVRFQPLKGIILRDYYPEKDMRRMSDLDILVDETNIESVTVIMNGLGYIQQKREEHHDVYINSDQILVEIHRYLYKKHTDQRQYDYFVPFKRSQLKKSYNYYYEYSLEDFYIYMIAHMARHFCDRGCGVRNIIDIYIYMSKFGDLMDSDYLKKEFTYCGLESFEQHMRKLSEIWLDTSEWTEFYISVFQYMLDCGTYGKDENGIWCKYANDPKKLDKLTRLKLRIWYLFPPKRYLIDDYPWLDKCFILLPISWIVRGGKGVMKHKGKDKLDLLKRTNMDEIKQKYEIYRNLKLNFHTYYLESK